MLATVVHVSPFAFFGHGLGAPSHDFDFSVVFVGDPDAAARKAIAKRLAAQGKPMWLGPFSSWMIDGKRLTAGLKSDPSFDDDPSRGSSAERGLPRDCRAIDTDRRLMGWRHALVGSSIEAQAETLPKALRDKLAKQHDWAEPWSPW